MHKNAVFAKITRCAITFSNSAIADETLSQTLSECIFGGIPVMRSFQSGRVFAV